MSCKIVHGMKFGQIPVRSGMQFGPFFWHIIQHIRKQVKHNHLLHARSLCVFYIILIMR